MIKTASILQQRVSDLIRRGRQDFESLALDVFAFQFGQNSIYRAHCERQRLTPATVDDWKRIPAVPTSAFKDFTIACFPVEEAVAEFHTSGTTQGKPGRHYFKTLELYDAAIFPQFRAHVLPDDAQLPALILTPSPAEAPHSSLVHMMSVVAPQGTYFVERGTLTLDKLAKAVQTDKPVMSLGTAFAFMHLFESGLRFKLPAGSRAMETGGFKGRSRELSKPELYELFERVLGIPATHVVNEYGMTELSTQFYDQTMRVGYRTDLKSAPAWARVLIIDPHTGNEAAHGQSGLIRIFDLANLWSAMCIQTEDLGVAHEGGFEILGRAPGAEVRGCSLTAELLNLS